MKTNLDYFSDNLKKVLLKINQPVSERIENGRDQQFSFIIDELIFKKPFFNGLRAEKEKGHLFASYWELVTLASYTMLTNNPKGKFAKFSQTHYELMCDKLEVFLNLDIPLFPADWSKVHIFNKSIYRIWKNI